MTQYWVIGGEYADKAFSEIVPGTKLERLGPFSDYDEAYTVWHRRAWETVDKCAVRYRIIEEADEGVTA